MFALLPAEAYCNCFTHLILLAYVTFALTLQSLPVTWCTNRFNIQELYFLSTLYLCVLYLSQNKQRLVPLTL